MTPRNMTEAELARGQGARATDCTCSRCEVTVSWMPGVERPDLPANWVVDGDQSFCLACRRDLAGEQAVAAAPDDIRGAERLRVGAAARLDFEVRRDPARADGRIAQACHTSITAVRKSRQRLGLYPSN